MILINNLNELVLSKFWDISETDNFLLLDKDYSIEKKYNNEELELITNQWLKLLDEYFELENNTKNKKTLAKKMARLQMFAKLQSLYHIVETLVYLYENQEILDLKTFKDYELRFYKTAKIHLPKYNIKFFDGIPTNVNIITRFIRGIESTYKIKYKEEVKAEKYEKKNRYSEIVRVGKILSMRLNPNEIMVSEWIEFKKLAIDEVEASNKQNNGKQ